MLACRRCTGRTPYIFDERSIDEPSPPQLTQLSAMAAASLAKTGIELPAEGCKIPVDKLNAALAQSSLTTQQRFLLKTEMAHAGLID